MWYHPLFSLIPEPQPRLRQKEGEKRTTLRNSRTALPDQARNRRSGLDTESWFARLDKATDLIARRKYPADRDFGDCVAFTPSWGTLYKLTKLADDELRVDPQVAVPDLPERQNTSRARRQQISRPRLQAPGVAVESRLVDARAAPEKPPDCRFRLGIDPDGLGALRSGLAHARNHALRKPLGLLLGHRGEHRQQDPRTISLSAQRCGSV